MRTGLVFISISILQLAYSVEKASGMVSKWSEDAFKIAFFLLFLAMVTDFIDFIKKLPK